MSRPRLIVFASGTKDGGGSGFRELVNNMYTGVLKADIVKVVSNHQQGGVRRIADEYGIPFHFFREPFTASEYQTVVGPFETDYVALSGWPKPVKGLDPARTFNIHPGPLPAFGGKGMFGHHVHDAVLRAYHIRKIERSAVCMHFVTKKYDEGPVFFYYPVTIRRRDTAADLAARVNEIEHGWQSWATNLVVNGQIGWDGEDPETLQVPHWYHFLPKHFESHQMRLSL